jgi:hypothetical protein
MLILQRPPDYFAHQVGRLRLRSLPRPRPRSERNRGRRLVDAFIEELRAYPFFFSHDIVSVRIRRRVAQFRNYRQEFHIIPIPNPDGYVYTWENDRFWYVSTFGAG